MKRLSLLAAILLGLAPAAIAAAPSAPGKFQTKITGKGAKTDHGLADGTWTIDLASPTSGKLHLTDNGKQKGGGTYSISGSVISLTPKKGGSCTTKAKYHFKLSANKLTFTKISDTCPVRVEVLTFSAWTKVG